MKQQVIKIRKQHNTKLPDSIIAASSVYTNIPLVTSDNNFEKIEALNLIKYNT
jgi:predicted nucleic acid-binding protein